MDQLRAWPVRRESVKVLKLPMSKESWRRSSRISHQLRMWAATGEPPMPRKVTWYSLERLSPRTMSWPAGEWAAARRVVVRRAELRRRREAGTGVVMGLPGRR